MKQVITQHLFDCPVCHTEQQMLIVSQSDGEVLHQCPNEQCHAIWQTEFSPLTHKPVRHIIKKPGKKKTNKKKAKKKAKKKTSRKARQ